ncbi:MAG: hypothetical protein R3C03_11620 [Pirellulaceae bacterium]
MNNHRHSSLRCLSIYCLFFVLVAASAGSTILADEWGVLSLKDSSGQIFGKLVEEKYKDPETGKICYVIETKSGGLIQIERSSAEWRATDSLMLEYEAKAAEAPQTAAGHRSVVEWCNESKAGSKLNEQIIYHLLQIVQLDPQDDDAARQLNMRGWMKFDGTWKPEAQYYESIGYVRDGRLWVSQLQAQVSQINESAEGTFDEAKSEFVRWARLLNRRSQDESKSKLNELLTEEMIPAIVEETKKLSDDGVRMFVVETIGDFPGFTAQDALIDLLLTDSSVKVRERALTMLSQPAFNNAQGANRSRACHLLLSRLSPNDENWRINWIAYALGELGDETAVLPLIGVIQTTHVIENPKAKPEGAMESSFSNTGNGGSFNFGNSEAKTIVVHNTNPEVLKALTKLTNVNAGGTSQSWQEWYLRNFTLQNVDVFRD